MVLGPSATADRSHKSSSLGPGLKFGENLLCEQPNTCLRILLGETAVTDLDRQVEVAKLLATCVEFFEDLSGGSVCVDLHEALGCFLQARLTEGLGV